MDDRVDFTKAAMLLLDEKGVEDLAAVEEQFLAKMREVERDCKRRCTASGESAQTYTVGLLRHPHRQSSRLTLTSSPTEDEGSIDSPGTS
jgi:hypothetical protein